MFLLVSQKPSIYFHPPEWMGDTRGGIITSYYRSAAMRYNTSKSTGYLGVGMSCDQDLAFTDFAPY
jgi:hypothetical protein